MTALLVAAVYAFSAIFLLTLALGKLFPRVSFKDRSWVILYLFGAAGMLHAAWRYGAV